MKVTVWETSKALSGGQNRPAPFILFRKREIRRQCQVLVASERPKILALAPFGHGFWGVNTEEEGGQESPAEMWAGA